MPDLSFQTIPLLRKIDEALAAARVALQPFTPGHVTYRLKADDDPVTAADQAVDDVLRSLLPVAGEGWLSEETSDSPERLSRNRVWIVDPIDGTREFIKGIPEWCISIGYAVDGEAIAGGICNPATGETIIGGVGHGVWYNGEHVSPSNHPSLRGARVLASNSEIRRGEWRAFEDLVHVVPTGSVAYKLALVAAGRADATWTLVPKNEWDVAAGVALLRGAGCAVMDRRGHALRFNRPDPLLPGVIASTPQLEADIKDLLLS